jgi:phenylalanine-4-hydroxylase
MTRTVDTLPDYLRQFCVEQDYSVYTPRDHAAWRYIMRQNRDFFKKNAHPVYEEGLKKTGISLSRIPRIEEMDESLKAFGWGAVAVRGFIPPGAFLEFQAKGVLAIATDMRTVEHIGYTPAPDIVHEAAGHAPIIANQKYADYLRAYGQVAAKAIITKEDLEVYEAIRYLSDIKENRNTPPEEVERAEKALVEVQRSVTHVSEATKVSRMAWWTNEYGLVGSIDDPKIYGAGLLSSVEESQHCLSARVKKVPLTVECVNITYDITEPQPQLFVTPHFEHLYAVLEDMAEQLAFRRGGLYGVQEAKQSETINTIRLDSGVEMSGVLTSFEHSDDEIEFIKLGGPTQLATAGKELEGHGIDRHSSGFSSPIGRWKMAANKTPSQLTNQELEDLGIRKGHEAKLEFLSGFEISGRVKDWYRSTDSEEGRLLYITWENCTVLRGKQIFFEPNWGDYDLVVGEKVISVYGGPASKEEYGPYEMGTASTLSAKAKTPDLEEEKLFKLYRTVREIREANLSIDETVAHLSSVAQEMASMYPREWLLGIELMEIAYQKLGRDPKEEEWLKPVTQQLVENQEQYETEAQEMIKKGLRLLEVRD